MSRMRPGLNLKVENTLKENGREDVVVALRHAFQTVMRPRFQSIVETATGRRVLAFMSGNESDPDMLGEVFVLEPRPK